jgi:hypothetical protein
MNAWRKFAAAGDDYGGALFCSLVMMMFFMLFSSAAFGATKTSFKSGPFGFPSTWIRKKEGLSNYAILVD